MRGTAKNTAGATSRMFSGHRVDALGEVHGGAGAQRIEDGEGPLGDVAQRQEGELLVALGRGSVMKSA